MNPATSQWRPFKDAPRDGRVVLATVHPVGLLTLIVWDEGDPSVGLPPSWYGIADDGSYCEDAFTHYAEIYPPEKGEEHAPSERRAT
jgi:hypothetical protein